MAPGEFRLRVRYAKSGRLRFLSHLELIHSLERSVRRAGLPYAVTQGFSPHMKVAFGPALPVGTAGDTEYYDVWLTRYTVAADVLARLQAATPEDLAPVEAHYVPDSAPSIASSITIVEYSVVVEGRDAGAEKVRAALQGIVGTGTLTVRHKGKDKVFDLARSLPKEVCVGDEDGQTVIRLTVRIGPEGSMRPELLVDAALAEIGPDAHVAHVTRTDMLVEGDDGVWSRPV